MDDLTAFAYALETTPAALLAPPADARTLTGVPDRFVAEEVRAWTQGRVKLTGGDLLRYWTDEAHHCQSYIKRFEDLLAQYDRGEFGVTPRDVYEERLETQRERLAFIRGRLLQLDPMGVPIDG